MKRIVAVVLAVVTVAVAPSLAASTHTLLTTGPIENAPFTTFTVTTAVDDIDNNLADNVCNGPSGCTLRAAIMQANRHPGDDVIMINAGINPVISRGQPDNDTGAVNDQANGDLDITCVISNPANDGCDLPLASNQNDLSIIGAAGGNTISAGTFTAYPVDGGGSINTDRVFDIGQDGIFGGGFGGTTGISVTLQNLTIQNGNVREALNATLGGGNYAFGGGIRFDGFGPGGAHGTLTLINSTIQNNQSDNAGGGVYQVYGTFSATNVTFSGNITKAGEGGGLSFGAATASSNVSIIDSTFSANEARQGIVFGNFVAGANGGGARIHAGNNTVTISNTNFTNNIAQQDGGGLKTHAGLVTVTGGTMTGNTARRHGGAAYGDRSDETDPSFLTFSGTTMRNNSANSDNSGTGLAAGAGGAVFQDRGVLTLTNCIIGGTGAGEPNTATDGGGVAHFFTSDTTGINTSNQAIININGGSINGNNATATGTAVANDGGGIYVNSALFDVNVSVVNIGQTTATAVTSNKARNHGGGIYISNGATANLKNQVLQSNQANSDSSGGGDGGGIYNNAGIITFNGGTVDSNTGGAGDGLTQSSGTFSGQNTINFNGDDSIALTGGTFNSTAGTLNLTGNFANSGATFNHSNGTVIFNGTGAQSLGGTTSSTFNILTVNKSSGTLTLGVNTAIGNVAGGGNLSLNAGTLDLSSFTLNRAAAGGTLTVANSTLLRIGGTGTLPSNFNTHSIGAPSSTIEYAGTNQGVATLNSGQTYANLTTSGSGNKTVAGAISVATNLTIGSGTVLVGGANAIGIGGQWTNDAGASGFTSSGTVTFNGTSQTVSGNTNFFNLTIAQGAGGTIGFGSTTTGIAGTFSRTSGTTMDPGTGTFTFTGNPGSITGASTKTFNNLQVNNGASVSNSSGGNLTVQNDYTNNGTFTQAAGLTTTFATGADGNHSLSGGGTTTFGVVTINSANTVDAGAHNFNVVGAAFNVGGTFTGNTGTVSFTGAGAQGVDGDGAKNFSGLLINNPTSVTVSDAAGAVDASVSGLLTLTTNLTMASGAILQQSGTSGGTADVLGTVRRTDLGGVTRSFGNLNNTVQINSGTAPTQLDFNLVKVTPAGFPAVVKVVPRTYTLTPVGGAGMSATLRLRYIDPAEVAGPGITESRLVLWKDTTGSDNWVAQGGTVDTAGNHVTRTGITSFSRWAIAEAADLTLSNANNVSGSAVVGQPWNWTLTAANTGAPATFTAGQTILTDNLPNSNVNYGTPVVQNASNITGSANISCSISSNDLTCSAVGGSVTFASNVGASSFDVVFSATPQAAGSYQNPRPSGGTALIDPDNVNAESNEANNSPGANTVTVGKANTTTTITTHTPNPSVVGQSVTVQWTVVVNAPGALGAALTGNVTVTDGTNQCVADVSAGQCDVTFASSGAKNLTATYAGDTNYNGSASTPATPHTVKIRPRVDLNGDGIGDAFTYNGETGAWKRAIAQGDGTFSETDGSWNPGWSVMPANFNPDNFTDIFLFNPVSGQWARMLNDGVSGFTTQATGTWWNGWQRFVMDLDADGLSDLFLYDPATGVWFKCIPTVSDFTCTVGYWNTDWEVTPMTLNADVFGDLFLFNGTTGRWFWALGEAGGSFTYPATDVWFNGWDLYPGDFNADGLTDLLLHDPPTGAYWTALNNGTGTGFTSTGGYWTMGWTPYVGDLDADGDSDLLLYHHPTGLWYKMLSDGAGGYVVGFSQTWSEGWTIHATDLNGDDRTDFLLYHPVTGVYYQVRNLGAGDFTYSSGTWNPGLTIVVRTPFF